MLEGATIVAVGHCEPSNAKYKVGRYKQLNQGSSSALASQMQYPLHIHPWLHF